MRGMVRSGKIDFLRTKWCVIAFPHPFEEESFARVAEGPNHGAVGDYFDGARKASERFFAGERGSEESEELSVLCGKRREDALGDFGVWAERGSGE